MTRLALVLVLFLGGCAASTPRIARVQTALGEPREVTVYLQQGEAERAVRLQAGEGVEVVEAKLDGDAPRCAGSGLGCAP